MTNKIEIARELAELCAQCLTNSGYMPQHDELRALIAAPAVERQELACETCHDQGEVFVSKGRVEYGMLTEPEPIYKACPVCASPPAPVAVVPDDVARDAGRYRWIRSQNVGHCEISRVLFETISDDCNPPYRSLKYGKDLDSAIDACLDKVKELNS